MRRNPLRPQDERARGSVRDAVLRGDLAVPAHCERCGVPNRRCSDGRRYLHAHHRDHAKPLDVQWLCARCHRAETPLAVMERNGSAKLTIDMIGLVKNLHSKGMTHTEIGRLVGVDRTTVSRVVRGLSWKRARTQPEAGNGR